MSCIPILQKHTPFSWQPSCEAKGCDVEHLKIRTKRRVLVPPTLWTLGRRRKQRQGRQVLTQVALSPKVGGMRGGRVPKQAWLSRRRRLPPVCPHHWTSLQRPQQNKRGQTNHRWCSHFPRICCSLEGPQIKSWREHRGYWEPGQELEGEEGQEAHRGALKTKWNHNLTWAEHSAECWSELKWGLS